MAAGLQWIVTKLTPPIHGAGMSSLNLRGYFHLVKIAANISNAAEVEIYSHPLYGPSAIGISYVVPFVVVRAFARTH